jgi:DNA-binding transcriptional ArsR family regulator
MPSKSSELVTWLRAAGEPSRLRLLALCGQRDLSVTDLARALGQSEPRVSRHLKILCESGLIQRVRNGQWVHYRLNSEQPVNVGAASFVQGLLAQLDRNDAQLRRDLDRALSGGADGSDANLPAAHSRLGRALQGFIEGSTSGERIDSALIIGVDHLELLESAASVARRCTAIAHSRRAAQRARAFAERLGLNCRVSVATAVGLSERNIVRIGQPFDVVILDHMAARDTEFAGMLAYGCGALAPTGRMWLFERYDSLEMPRGKVIEHPLARLRRLLGELNLSCERLSPIEADGEHVLAAVAVPAAGREQSTLRRA